jgi:branched-chain amino acid transport system permease protein
MSEQTALKGVAAAPKPGQKSRVIFLLVLLAVLFLFPLLQVTVGGYNYWLHMALYTLMYITMASSWNIIGGYAGYVSLGHNVFFAVGAYFAGMMLARMGISPFLMAPVAGVVAFIVGLAVGLLSLRTRGPAFIITTIALVMMASLLFDKWKAAGGANGLSLPLIALPAVTAKLPFYYGMLILAIGSVWLSYVIRHSKFGLGLRAISQNEVKAESSGIPTSEYKILAFAISAVFVGMAGSLWGYYLTYLRPSLFLTITLAATLVLMVILGGKGTVAGPVVGAILLVGINEFMVAQFGSTALNIVATGVLMIVVLLFFPGGIIGTLHERGWLPSFLNWE